MDVVQLARVVLPASVFLVVMSVGLRASFDDATYLFRRPRMLLRAVVAMYVVMPCVAGAMAIALGLHPAVRVALVAVAISPVPPFLPTRQLRVLRPERQSLVYGCLVAMSALAVVVVPVMVTLLGHLAGRELRADSVAIARIVAITVLVPLAVGMALRAWWPAARRVGHLTARLGNVLLAIAAGLLIVSHGPAMLSLIGNGTLLAIVAMTIIGLGVGHLLGGPDDDFRSVLALATAARHPGVAAVAAGATDQTLAPAAILLYLFVGFVISAPYVAWRKRLKPSGGSASAQS